MSGGVVMWKTFWVWITFYGEIFGFVKMSGERYMGDNPFGGIWFPHFHPPVNIMITVIGPVAMPSKVNT